MLSKEKIEMSPIGFVKTKVKGEKIRGRSHSSQIILHQDLENSLEGIEEFSHLFIIFWMHEIPRDERKRVKVHPRGRDDMPLLGVLATRSAYHPNPIGLTLVELVEVKGNVLTVRGLDAFNGTPIIDIKPFDYWDITEDARVPEWWMKLEKERTN